MTFRSSTRRQDRWRGTFWSKSDPRVGVSVAAAGRDRDGMARSAVSSLRTELIALRSHRGASIEKLDGPQYAGLRNLDAVSDYLRRHPSLTEADRNVAAYRVIACTVERLILRPDWNVILQVTLNLGQGESTLSARQRSLMVELVDPQRRNRDTSTIAAMSEKAFERLQNEAYVQLAGVLATLDTSPCDVDRPPSSIDLQLTVTLDAADLGWLTNALRLDPRPHIRDEIAQAAISLLPQGAGAARAELLGASSPSDIFVALLVAAQRYLKEEGGGYRWSGPGDPVEQLRKGWGAGWIIRVPGDGDLRWRLGFRSRRSRSRVSQQLAYAALRIESGMTLRSWRYWLADDGSPQGVPSEQE
jgi:hypothetical protein